MSNGELLELRGHFQRLLNGVITLKGFGICGNLPRHLHMPAIKLWQSLGYHGNYPVRVSTPIRLGVFSPKRTYTAQELYDFSPKPAFWNPNHPYGKARIALLKHCVSHIDNVLAAQAIAGKKS